MNFLSRHRQAYCQTCRSERTFRKPNPQHGFHAVGVILTLGLWLIPWAAFTIHWFWRQPWRCRRCRSVLCPSPEDVPSDCPVEPGHAKTRVIPSHGQSMVEPACPGVANAVAPRSRCLAPIATAATSCQGGAFSSAAHK